MNLDIRQLGSVEFNRQIQILTEKPDVSAIEVVGCDGQDLVGLTLNSPIPLRFQGSLGDYCFAASQRAMIEVHGDIGSAAALGIRGGAIVVRGNAADSFGAFGKSGLASVYGRAGDRCAVGLRGAEIVVRGNVGADAGFFMHDGTLVIGGSAGTSLGAQMVGGTIFLRGEAASVAEHLHVVRMKESDRFQLSLLMLKAGIKSTGVEFRMYRVARS